ncbi:hypothetical protein STEG23_021007, partial [Scotinomys teguina]
MYMVDSRIPEGPVDQGTATGRVRVLEEQLVKAKEQIENYKKQARNGLGKDHEILRRRIENGAKELWFFLQSELKKLKNLEGNELQRHADEILLDLGHHERSTLPPFSIGKGQAFQGYQPNMAYQISVLSSLWFLALYVPGSV